MATPRATAPPGAISGAVGDPTILFSRLTPHDAAAEVTDRLMAAVALGLYLPGERLPTERDLAGTLGVSRAIVRESLARLRAHGVVETRRGRSGGAFVLSSWGEASAAAVHHALAADAGPLEDLFDTRELVEGTIARAAARRRTPADLTAIRAGLDAFLTAGTPREHHRTDMDLHRSILLAAHNAGLVEITRALLTGITPGIAIEPYSEDMDARAALEHTELVEAIAAGDAERAGLVAEQHFQITAATTRRVRARGSGTGREDPPVTGDGADVRVA